MAAIRKIAGDAARMSGMRPKDALDLVLAAFCAASTRRLIGTPSARAASTPAPLAPIPMRLALTRTSDAAPAVLTLHGARAAGRGSVGAAARRLGGGGGGPESPLRLFPSLLLRRYNPCHYRQLCSSSSSSPRRHHHVLSVRLCTRAHKTLTWWSGRAPRTLSLRLLPWGVGSLSA